MVPQIFPDHRRGFTLVELIVVITLLLVLAAIAVMFVPAVNDQDKAGQAARQLMGWLQDAKMRAMRDRQSRGLRFLPSAAAAAHVMEAQYIEQPDDFKQGMLVKVLGAVPLDPANPFRPANFNQSSWVVFSGVDFYGGFGTADPKLWPVQPGRVWTSPNDPPPPSDYLEINGGGIMWRITPHPYNPTNNANLYPLVPNLAVAGLVTCNTLKIDMVNTISLTFPQNPLPVVGPGTFTVRVHNPISLAAGMSVTIGTGDNEEVVQVTNVQNPAIPNSQVTFANAVKQHANPFPIRNNPVFPVASEVNAQSQPGTPALAGGVYNGTFTVSNAPGNVQGILAGSRLRLTDRLTPPGTVEDVTVTKVVGNTVTVNFAKNIHPAPVPPNLQRFFRIATPPPPKQMPYRIVRAPRLSGEETLQLPVNTAIDLTPKATTPDKIYDLPTGASFDLLFSPSGSVVGPLAAYDKVIFWVRDVSQPNITDNEPVLVCVYTRTGAIVPHKVDPRGGAANTSYYTYTVDGRPSEGP